MQENIVKGYKVTDKNMQCRGYQYELNKLYTHNGKIELCGSGFHFCLQAVHCFKYYDFTPRNRVFEIEASGNIEHGDDKSCCNEIKLVREVAWEEVLKIVNTGVGNTGLGNTGDWNTGDSNTGYSNTGDSNTGYSNTGNRNTGDWNTGDWNTGYRNTGYSNTGYSNTGNRNTGNRNTGDWNTGYRNTGYSNTGDSNTGNSNTGDWNTGDRNTGYSNTGNRNGGAFCTGEEKIKLFNKESDWTIEDFENSRAFYLMRNYVDTKMWIPESRMTDEEKAAYPSYKTAEGYLKDIPFKESFTNAWHNWSEENKIAFTSLPNFDWQIFTSITGVEKESC